MDVMSLSGALRVRYIHPDKPVNLAAIRRLASLAGYEVDIFHRTNTPDGAVYVKDVTDVDPQVAGERANMFQASATVASVVVLHL